MCGRFTLRASPREVAEHFGLWQIPDFIPRYNIAPGQQVGIVRVPLAQAGQGQTEAAGQTLREVQHDNDQGTPPDENESVCREWAWVKWGLIPHWADDPAIANRLINARAETVATKPAFRSAARYRRCLIPADGFYEWKKSGRGKQPFFVRLKGDQLFALAGLWDVWQSPKGEVVETCTILTVEPNKRLATLHNRMPLILPPEAYAEWLSPNIQDFRALEKWVRPYPDDSMELLPVSSYVNSARNEGPRCLETVSSSGELFS